MTDSKFLKWQDRDNDGLIDVCKVDVESVATKCLPCSPNPLFSPPNWRNLSKEEPYFNEKNCTYQIAVVTSSQTLITSAGVDNSESLFEEYRATAVEYLLLGLDKENTTDTRKKVSDVIVNKDYYLDFRPNTYVVLLYEVSYETIVMIDNASGDGDSDSSDDDGDEEEDSGTTTTVVYTADELHAQLLKVRQAFKLYNIYLNAYRTNEGGNLFFEEGANAGTSPYSTSSVFNFDLYGDMGFSPKGSALGKLLIELEEFLNSKKLRIPGVGMQLRDFGREAVESMEFDFGPTYKLKQLRVYTISCGSTPTVFRRRQSLKLLTAKGTWRDPTAVAYFARATEIADAVSARNPPPWLDVVTQFTYPPIFSTFNHQINLEEQEGIGSCIGQALYDEGKQLAQDIFNEAFSLADAIKAKFNQQACYQTAKQVEDRDISLGKIWDPKYNINTPAADVQRQVLAIAREQAYKKITTSDKDIRNLCVAFANLVSGQYVPRSPKLSGGEITLTPEKTSVMPGNFMPTPPAEGEGEPAQGGPNEEAWRKVFDRLRNCGLRGLAMSAINCLLKGVSLEEGLAKIIEGAMESMDLEYFDQIFVGIPYEKQVEIQNVVKRKIAEGDIFKDTGIMQNASDDIVNNSSPENPQLYENISSETVTSQENAGAQALGDDAALDTESMVIEEEFSRTLTWPWTRFLDSMRGVTQQARYGTYDAADAERAQDTRFADASAYDISNPAGETYGEPTSAIIRVVDGQEVVDTGQFGEQVIGSNPPRENTQTVLETLNFANEQKQEEFDSSILSLYIQALLEVYQDDLMDIMAILDTLPGAPLIKLFLQAMDCPVGAPFKPAWTSFINDIQFPICKDSKPVVWPSWRNPFKMRWKDFDFGKIIANAALEALQVAIMKILISMLEKICLAIGQVGCKAIAVIGDMATAAFKEETFAELVRDTICGAGADDTSVDNTISDLFAQLGMGEDAFSDQESVLNFTKDISSSVTRSELANALLGQPSADMLKAVDRLLENEYSDMRSAFPNQDLLAKFFANVGNLMPAADRAALADYAAQAGTLGGLPANPSLCGSPAQIDNFEKARCALLADRTTPEQCLRPGMSPRMPILDDIKDLTQDPRTTPQMLSDPGCDNGLLPLEPSALADSTKDDLSADLEQVKSSFVSDMLGNGALFGGHDDWGMINMMMSDTLGRPYTKHVRKVAWDWFKQNNVDFYVPEGSDGEDDDGINYANIRRQYGAWPIKVASWLQQEFATPLAGSFESNNDWNPNTQISTLTVDLKDFRSITHPQWGYNIGHRISNATSETVDVTFIERTRKSTPDAVFEFSDNNHGLRSEGYTSFDQAFFIQWFINDIQNSPMVSTITPGGFEIMGDESVARGFVGASNEDQVRNRPGDNSRVKIVKYLNQATQYDLSAMQYAAPDKKQELLDVMKGDAISCIEEPLYEFVATSDILDTMDLSAYTKFNATFEVLNDEGYTPPVILLQEIIAQNNTTEVPDDAIKSVYDYYMNQLINNFSLEISGNNNAFMFGARQDTLKSGDVKYVVKENQTNSPAGTLYSEALITEEDGTERFIRGSDQILGISGMEYSASLSDENPENRVFYLDPAEFGSSYMNPKIYIKPAKDEGWMGFLDVCFPDYTPCKPHNTDLVDFASIDEQISDDYNYIPEDPRFGSTKDCLVELPYDRLLEREATAGIGGLITALIRIYCATHFIKGLPTFGTFKASFPDNYSSIYAHYIIETMEEGLLDAQPDFGERFNTFKDDEFWYAFLEQCVQYYARQAANNDQMEVPVDVQKALRRLRQFQSNYRNQYASRDTLKRAKEDGSAEWWRTLTGWRYEKNLDAIKQTAEDAKIVMAELVKRELEAVATSLHTNMETANLTPIVSDIYAYLLENYTLGTTDLELDKDIKEEYVDSLPQSGNNLYTSGGEFYVFEIKDVESELEVNQDYVGYYHVHIDEDGDPIYMVGEVHTESPHDLLRPLTSQIIVPIGDVSPLGFSYEFDASKPFILEKYISIDGVKYDPDTALAKIREHDPTLNVSDVYPGTLKLVEAAELSVTSTNPVTGLTDTTYPYGRGSKIVGVEGELGIKYGLQLSMHISTEELAYESFLLMLADIAANGLPDDVELDSDILSYLENLVTVGVMGDSIETVVSAILESSVGESIIEVLYNIYARNLGPDGETVNTKVFLTDVEVSALDVKLGAFPPLEGNSKLLLCLFNMLKDDDTFKLLTRYIFPLNKITSLLAVYNSMAILDSIGEVTVPPGTKGSGDQKEYPGRYITWDDSGEWPVPILEEGKVGWYSYSDRKGSVFFVDYDEWDRVLLRKSNKTVKKLFKHYYHDRGFDRPGKDWKFGMKPSFPRLQNLRQIFKGMPGFPLLARWQKRKLTSNPFNAKGEMCSTDSEEG